MRRRIREERGRRREGEFWGFSEGFGGEDIRVGSGKEGGSFRVGLVGAFTRGTGFAGGDGEWGIDGIGES